MTSLCPWSTANRSASLLFARASSFVSLQWIRNSRTTFNMTRLGGATKCRINHLFVYRLKLASNFYVTHTVHQRVHFWRQAELLRLLSTRAIFCFQTPILFVNVVRHPHVLRTTHSLTPRYRFARASSLVKCQFVMQLFKNADVTILLLNFCNCRIMNTCTHIFDCEMPFLT